MQHMTPPVRVELADGNTYEVSRLEARFLHEIGEMMRSRRLDATIARCPDDQNAILAADLWDPSIHEILEALDVPRYYTHVLRACIQDRNRGLSDEQIDQLMGTPHELMRVFKVLRDLPAAAPAQESDATNPALQPPPGTEMDDGGDPTTRRVA